MLCFCHQNRLSFRTFCQFKCNINQCSHKNPFSCIFTASFQLSCLFALLSNRYLVSVFFVSYFLTGSGINGPQTIEGKMATLIYAGIGIPLMLLFLASIGNLLANTFRCFYQNCCLCSSKTSANHQSLSSQHNNYDHYHVQLLKLNDINPNSRHVNLHCNSIKNDPLNVNTFFTPNHDCVSLTANQTDGPFFINHQNPTNETLEGINNCPQIGVKMCPNVDQNTSFPRLILREAHPNYTFDDNETIIPNTDHLEQHHHHHHHHIHPEAGTQLPNRTSILNEINHIEAGPLYEYIKNSQKHRSAKVNVPLVWCLILIIGYLLLGAAVVYIWEGWSFCDGLYFCFLSLSTIGLGPANEMLTPFQSSIQKLALYSLYILGGLSLIAMCFNLAQDLIVFKFHLWTKKLGISTDDEATEEAVIVTQSPTINPVINEQDFVI